MNNLSKMSNSNESTATRRMLDCILYAPTCPNLPAGHPTLTHLDREREHRLELRKLANDELDNYNKLDEDRLLVSIRLGLNQDSLPTDLTERDLFNLWKQLHPKEPLFDVKHSGPEENGANGPNTRNRLHYFDNYNYAHFGDVGNEFIDLVTFEWNRGQVAKLDIQFHAVSSQFPFYRDPTRTPLDQSPVFVLHVNVSSRNVTSWVYYFVCQFKLYWPGEGEKANLRAQLLSHRLQTSNEDTGQELMPSCEYTVLKLTTMNLNEKQLVRVDEVSQPPKKQLQAFTVEPDSVSSGIVQDYIDIHPTLTGLWNRIFAFIRANTIICSIIQDHFVYSPKYDRNLFVEFKPLRAGIGPGFHGYFYEHGEPFTIVITRNMKNLDALLEVGGIVHTRILLDLNHRELSEAELENWVQYQDLDLRQMLQLDYRESKLANFILDIRQQETNCIDLYWIPPKRGTFEIRLALRINCLSSEFQDQYDPQPGDTREPDFRLSLSSQLFGTHCELETVHARLCSVAPETGLTTKMLWLQTNAPYTHLATVPETAARSLDNLLLNSNLSQRYRIHWRNLVTVCIALGVTLYLGKKFKKWLDLKRRIRMEKIKYATNKAKELTKKGLEAAKAAGVREIASLREKFNRELENFKAHKISLEELKERQEMIRLNAEQAEAQARELANARKLEEERMVGTLHLQSMTKETVAVMATVVGALLIVMAKGWGS